MDCYKKVTPDRANCLMPDPPMKSLPGRIHALHFTVNKLPGKYDTKHCV